MTTATLPAADAELAQSTGRALGRLMRVLTRAKAEAALASGRADVGTVPLLAALAEAGPMRSNALALAVYSDPSTVSRQVAALVDAGHVERRPDPDDRRAGLLALTDSGATALADRCRERDRHLARVTAGWSEPDRRALAALLDRLAADLAADLHRTADLHRPVDPQRTADPHRAPGDRA